MKIKHIKGSTFCIDTGMTYIPFYKVNDEEIIMLDTGTRQERKGIEKLLKENHFKVLAILCTHSHIDHAGNNAYLKEKHHSIIAIPEEEAWACNSLKNLKVHFNAYDLVSVKEHYGHLVFDADILLSPEDKSVYLCGVKFGIIPTPGHSISHISIVTPDDVAYLGDCLIGYDVMKGAKMPYACFLKMDLESKSKLLDIKHSKYVIAHKGIYDDIHPLVKDNIEFFKYRASRIYNLIQGSMSLDEIMQSINKNFHIRITSVQKHNVIERMLRSFLEYLVETGRLEMLIEESVIKYRKIKI